MSEPLISNFEHVIDRAVAELSALEKFLVATNDRRESFVYRWVAEIRNTLYRELYGDIEVAGDGGYVGRFVAIDIESDKRVRDLLHKIASEYPSA